MQEQLLRLGRRGPELRPFCESAGVRHRGYSQRLQRAMVDFGAEHSFGKATQRVQEHYGIQVPVEAVRQYTLRHGRSINPMAAGALAPAQTLVVQMDGSMIPVVHRGSAADGRKGKQLLWREARLCLARASDKAEALYGASLGSAQTAGWLWREVALKAGLGHRTHVHGLGDGAPWIVDQFRENFGQQGSYLLDFYHVSEYLAQAASRIARTAKQREWTRRQQGRLLNNQHRKVLRSLEPHLESSGTEEAPVSAAHRYLTERHDYLDYVGAKTANLPIGSGEIESGHRHVIQKRLKLAGAWWKETHAQAMLNLRTARANNQWSQHWMAEN